MGHGAPQAQGADGEIASQRRFGSRVSQFSTIEIGGGT